MKGLFALMTFALVVSSPLAVWAQDEASSGVQQEADAAKKMKKVIELFFTALRKANLSQAYYAYTSVDFRKTSNWHDFKLFIQRFPSMERNFDYKIVDHEFYDTLGTVDVSVMAVDHSENLVVFDMVWESGQWRILGMQIYRK